MYLDIKVDSRGTLTQRQVNFVAGARNFLSVKADEALQDQIDIGNDKYRITVDGKEGYSREAIYHAKKIIRINFTRQAMGRAAKIAVDTLRRAVKRYYPDNDYVRDKNLSANSVTAFLCEKGKPSQVITDLENVDVELDQYIVVTIKRTPGYENMTPFANWWAAHQYGKRGFFERAARNLRKRLGTSRETGAVRVVAKRLRNRQLYQPLSQNRENKRPDLKGKINPIPYDIGTTTSWCLIIEPRRNKGQAL